jgi:DNA polymerase III sliding clamp (beta) subunit (PCNA family)
MEIIVNFGIGNGIYLDDRKPLEQVKLVKKLIKEGEDFEIVTFSPYVLEAIDAFKGDAVVKYFNDRVESSLVKISDEISEAYNLITN